MSKKSLYKLMTVVLLVVMLLSACAPAATQAPAPEATQAPVQPAATDVPAQPAATEAPAATKAPAATEAPATAPAAGDKPSGKVVVWGWSFEDFEKTGLNAEFKAEYPDIELEFVKYAAGDTYQNLLLAISAGQGAPDVVQLENSHLAQYVELGGLTDITTWVTPYLDKMNKAKWVDARKDGKYYAMPWDTGPVVMYYRRDVFKEAGISTDPAEVDKLVSTWDGYLALCKTIKEKTGKNCFANSAANNDARLYEIALWQQGLGYFDKSGTVTVDSPENIATLEKLGEFNKAAVTSEEVPWTDPWYAELNSPDKSTATLVEASWMGVFLKSWIAGELPAGTWGVTRMPAFKEGQPRAANDGGSTMAIPEQSQNKEAAWAYIEFMLGREKNAITLFKATDFLPSLETTFTDPIFQQEDPYFAQKARQIYLEVAKVIPEANIYGPHYSLMNGYVQTAIQKYLTGAMPAADALKEAAESIRLETGMQ